MIHVHNLYTNFPVKKGYIFLLTLLTIITLGCGTTKKAPLSDAHPPPQKTEEDTPAKQFHAIIDPQNIPETPREMRGVWVASAANLDWPSKPGLPVVQQKAELIAIMDRVAELNMNAIILQVRPSADALYDSPYEPWSEFLTGKQGRTPEPFYDPPKICRRRSPPARTATSCMVQPFSRLSL